MKNLQTLNVLPILALASLLVKISGSSSLRPVLTGRDIAYLGTRAVFWCTAPDSSPPVTYELMWNDFMVSTATDPEGNQPAQFVLKVTAASEGSYYCNVTAGGSTGVSNSIKLSVVTPPSNTRVTSEPFPPVAYKGLSFELSCNAMGSHLSYTWFFNRKQLTSSSSPSFHLTGNKLVIRKVTPEHAGNYSCMVWSMVQDIRRISSSTEVQVIVKVQVSKPGISFSMSKEGDSYHGNVTCWSTRGSPPVNFSLSLDDREVGSVMATGPLIAWFPVAMVPGLDMGVAQCRVKNEVQDLTSEPVTLVVVPVGGNVKVEVEYLYRADSTVASARLSCQVGRGTFPYVSWLFNDTVLPSETHVDSHIHSVLSHYALADHGKTLFLAKLGPAESGLYRCRARDSYDDSGPWVESAAVLIQATDRNVNPMPPETPSTETSPNALMTTMTAITVLFCCFLLLALAVCVGCVYMMFGQDQAHGHVDSTAPSTDVPPLFSPLSQSQGKQADFSSTDCNVQNQTMESTI